MTNVALIPALLSTFISLSGCVFHTLSVRRGDNITLQCANFTRIVSHVFWFKMNDRHNASSIATMRSPDSNVTLYEGFESGKFSMSSDSVILNLTIKQVDSSDSGLYFCGFKSENCPGIQDGTSLIVEEEPQAEVTLMRLNICALVTVLLGVVAALAVKIRRLQKDRAAGTNEDLGLGVQNYASLDFQEAQRGRSPPPPNWPELNVVTWVRYRQIKRGTASQKI